MSEPQIKDIRANYSFQHGEHMVLVDQYREGQHGNHWGRITVLFAKDAEAAKHTVSALNRKPEAAAYIERLEAALKDCVEELESGIETEHELEAEHSKAARELVSRARAALQTGGA